MASADRQDAKLEGNGDEVAARERRNAEIEALGTELERISAPIVDDLQRVGYAVSDLWDLEDKDSALTNAYPVLVSHLAGDYPDSIVNTVSQYLAHPGAVAYWSRVKELYVEARVKERKEGFAIALAGMAGKKQLPELLALINDRENGQSRVFLLRRANRLLGREIGYAFVRSLMDDPQLSAEAERIAARKAPND